MWEISEDAPCPRTLQDALSQKFPSIDNWRERFEWGGILVNGRPMALSTELSPLLPVRIEFYQPKVEWEQRWEQYPVFDPAKHIVYHDHGLLIAFKPAGLPTNPSKDQHRCCLQTYLTQEIGPVHMPSRLDMGTSGLIAVSTEKELNKQLQLVFEKHHIHKEYLFVVEGAWPWPVDSPITVERPIGRHPDHPILRAATTGTESKGYVLDNGKTEVPKEAVTRFSLVARKGDKCLVLAAPLTGRTHQIRVHTASLGFPIVGDTFYGGAEAKELNLLSYRIRLGFHPVSKQPVNVTVPAALLPPWVTEVFASPQEAAEVIDAASLLSANVQDAPEEPESKLPKKAKKNAKKKAEA